MAPCATTCVWMHPRATSGPAIASETNFLKVKVRISSSIFLHPYVVQTCAAIALSRSSCLHQGLSLTSSLLQKNSAVVKLLQGPVFIMQVFLVSTICSQLYTSICFPLSLSDNGDNLRYGKSSWCCFSRVEFLVMSRGLGSHFNSDKMNPNSSFTITECS